jgi:hypothetical protein
LILESASCPSAVKDFESGEEAEGSSESRVLREGRDFAFLINMTDADDESGYTYTNFKCVCIGPPPQQIASADARWRQKQWQLG